MQKNHEHVHQNITFMNFSSVVELLVYFVYSQNGYKKSKNLKMSEKNKFRAIWLADEKKKKEENTTPTITLYRIISIIFTKYGTWTVFIYYYTNNISIVMINYRTQHYVIILLPHLIIFSCW